MERKDELEAQVRKTSLRERLDECRTRIGKMCSEGRPPRMCIPVQWDDDDFYISTTLADAQRALDAEREKVGESDPRIVMDPKPLTGAPTPVRYAAFNALLREIKTLHDSKGADYEDGGEEYSNLTAAEDWGIPAWTYAMLRANEKMNRLKAYAKGSTLQHEGARDSLIDIAVLSLIAVVVKERA